MDILNVPLHQTSRSDRDVFLNLTFDRLGSILYETLSIDPSSVPDTTYIIRRAHKARRNGLGQWDPSLQVVPLMEELFTLALGRSNLWLEQMAMRCPKSTYLGVARLSGYRWIVNDRGYANVVEVAPSDESTRISEESPIVQQKRTSDHVWGLVYRLQPEDGRRLDVNEGVPHSYTKEMLTTHFWAAPLQPDAPFKGWDKQEADIGEPGEQLDLLVYIDRKRTIPDKPKYEYIYRMNMGVKDALKAGVPHDYVQDVVRQFIPDRLSGDFEQSQALALKQAANFEDE